MCVYYRLEALDQGYAMGLFNLCEPNLFSSGLCVNTKHVERRRQEVT